MSQPDHPFATVLVATDLSELSVGALQSALGLITRLGGDSGDLTVLHVRHPARRLADVEGAFEGHLDRALGESVRDVGHMVRSGDAADEIVAMASKIGADLVVMGTHGRTGLRRLIVGSVAEQVAREAPCPVLVVGRRPLGAGRDMPKSLAQLFPLRQIVVPTDGSECSRIGEDLGAILAARCEGSVHLVHVEDEGWADGAGEGLLAAKEKVEQAAKALGGRREGAPKVPLVTHARTGAPAEQIAACAEELSADLIVMGTHGRTGVRERAIGGQTDQVMRMAQCPVLVVREKSVLIETEEAEASSQES